MQDSGLKLQLEEWMKQILWYRTSEEITRYDVMVNILLAMSLWLIVRYTYLEILERWN